MSYEITLTNAGHARQFDARLVAQLQEYGIYSAEVAKGKTVEELRLIEPNSLATLVTFHCGCEFLALEDIEVVNAMVEKAGKVVS